jgi:phosphate uptake regulator
LDGDDMDTRKIQVTGKSTYIMTLPKKWVNESLLSAGSSVTLSYQEDGSLVISPPALRKNTALKRLSMKENLDELKRNVIGTYIMGSCQFLEINGIKNCQEGKNEIRKLCKVLIGFEIVEVEGSRILIQDILDTDEFTIEAGFKRVASLIFQMLNCLVDSLRTADREIIRDIISKDEDVNQLFFLLSKLFTSRLSLKKASKNDRLSLIEAFYYRLAAGELEKIAGLVAEIARNLEKIVYSEEEAEKLLDLGLFARQFIQDCGRSLRLSDVQLANDVLKDKVTFEKKILALNGPTSEPALEIITESFGRIKNYAGNIAELTIDLSQL